MAFICGYMGRIVKEPEVKQTNSGKSICNFTIANDEGWGDRKRTDFMQCLAWEKTATTIQKFFHKGDNIIVEGRFENHPWQKNEKGYDIPNWQYIVQKIHFLPKNKDNTGTNTEYTPYGESSSQAQNQATGAPVAQPSDDFTMIDSSEDLPF